MKNKILNKESILNSQSDLLISQEELADESDVASSIVNQYVSFNIRERELSKLKLIDNALQRIIEGTYGICEECQDVIHPKRLKNQPWTNLCIVHAEEFEREYRGGQYKR